MNYPLVLPNITTSQLRLTFLASVEFRPILFHSMFNVLISGSGTRADL